MDTKGRRALLAEKARSSKSSLRERAFAHGSTPVWYKWQPTEPFVLLHLISNKQEQMRLSFTLEERNLTSAHKQPIDNWARLQHRSTLGTVWKGWSDRGRDDIGYALMGSCCIFHVLKLANYARIIIAYSSILEFEVWVTRLTTSDFACVNLIGWKHQGDEFDPWPRNHQMPR